MNKKDKDKIALILVKIAKEVNKFLSSDENKVSPTYNSSFLLVSSFDEEREEIHAHLLKDQTYTAKFSEEYLEKLLKEKVTTMMQQLSPQAPADTPRLLPQKIARETAEAIFYELDSYKTTQAIYLPVSGITIQLEEGKLELGNITLQAMTQEKTDELQNYITSSIMATSHTPEEKQSFIHYFAQDLKRIFKEKDQPAYAIYRVIAEPIQAEKRAREECYKVFDLLRYALPIISTLYPMDFSIPQRYLDNDKGKINKYTQREKKAHMEIGKSIYFGLENEIGTFSDFFSSSIILRDSPSFNWKTSRIEQHRPFLINAQTLEGLRQAKVFEASQIINKGDAFQTNFERCVLRSIHWFANAQTPMQPDYVFLSLMSSIEAFLNPPRNHEGTTSAIVEGVAALGGEPGYTYTKKRINDLYSKRSALSHGDSTEITQRDIAELRAIAFYLIHQMIQSTDEFTTQEQVYEAVKKMREGIKQSRSNIDS